MNFSKTYHLYDHPYPLFVWAQINAREQLIASRQLQTVVIVGPKDPTFRDLQRARQIAGLYLYRGNWRIVVEDTWSGISGAVRRFEDRRIWAVSKHEFESIMQSAVIERVGVSARAA